MDISLIGKIWVSNRIQSDNKGNIGGLQDFYQVSQLGPWILQMNLLLKLCNGLFFWQGEQKTRQTRKIRRGGRKHSKRKPQILTTTVINTNGTDETTSSVIEHNLIVHIFSYFVWYSSDVVIKKYKKFPVSKIERFIFLKTC